MQLADALSNVETGYFRRGLMAVSGFVLLALAACNNPPPPTINAGVASDLNTIGIVSLVQNNLDATQASGPIIFMNEHFVYEADEWEIQSRTEAVLRETLANYPKISVVPLEYDAKNIWETYKDDNDGGGLFATYALYAYARLEKYLRPVVEGKELDAVLVVYPAFNTSLCPEKDACASYGDWGFGLLYRRSLDAYVAVQMDLLDAKTLKPIAGTLVNEHQPLPRIKLLPSLQQIDPASRRAIKEAIDELLETYIPSGLYKIDLLS